jgi:hypothetical protein
MTTVHTFLLVACCSGVLWGAVAAHALIVDNGMVANGIIDNGIIENGIIENGIVDNGCTANRRTEKSTVFDQTSAMINGENGRSTYPSEGLSFHGLSQKGLGKKQP